ncbi:MAG: hypothetical protein M1814_002250 [Vezdaea aestivalis]|nr:MAG: hypothetical protein M1814_002250 [Vezdaea aestivalis]
MVRPISKSTKAETSKKRGAPVETPSRQSKRVKSLPNNPTGSQSKIQTSKYFEEDEESDDQSADAEESVFEGSEDSAEDVDTTDAPDVLSEPESDDEDDGRRTASKYKSKRLTNPKTVTKLTNRGRTGHGPGVEVITRLPAARTAGKTPYEDHTIHPNTFLFLTDLKKNNDRDWLKRNDVDYRTSQKDFDSFVSCLTHEVIKKDETIPELPVKDIIFRIYRDVRFSKEKTPYKVESSCQIIRLTLTAHTILQPYFSVSYSRTGRKGPYAGYYIQAQPGGGSFVGGGLWHPEPDSLAKMRRAIDRHSNRLKAVLSEANFRQHLLGGVKNDQNKVIKAFVAKNSEDALKSKPKGYDLDNKNLDLLRLKSYTVGTKLTDDEVIGPNGLTRIADLVGWMSPFITYLNSVVMPDEEDESEDAEDDASEP